MKKSDNYGRLGTFILLLIAFVFIALSVIYKEVIAIHVALAFVILTYIDMAVITIKKHIDKTFEDKVRNIEKADIYLNENVNFKVVKNDEVQND